MHDKEQHGPDNIPAVSQRDSGSLPDLRHVHLVKINEIGSAALSIGVMLSVPLFIYLCFLRPDFVNLAVPLLTLVTHLLAKKKKRRECTHCHR